MNKIIKYLSPHLSVLALLPCVLLSGVLAYDFYHSYHRMQNAYETEYNAFMSHGVLKVVHEVQKERGATAGYLGSKGQRFSSQLKTQRQTVDAAYRHLLDESKHWTLSKNMQSVFGEFTSSFSRLNTVRNQVDFI